MEASASRSPGRQLAARPRPHQYRHRRFANGVLATRVRSSVHAQLDYLYCKQTEASSDRCTGAQQTSELRETLQTSELRETLLRYTELAGLHGRGYKYGQCWDVTPIPILPSYHFAMS